MAATLPTRKFHVPFTKWSFSLNPGPFNLKEHVLITIFASAGSGGVYAVYIITALKAFYHRNINGFAAFLLAITTQVCTLFFLYISIPNSLQLIFFLNVHNISTK